MTVTRMMPGVKLAQLAADLGAWEGLFHCPVSGEWSLIVEVEDDGRERTARQAINDGWGPVSWPRRARAEWAGFGSGTTSDVRITIGKG